jgi:hypothetical protein
MKAYADWAHTLRHTTWFLGVEDGGGRCHGGVTLRVHASRALPGFRILRIERFGGNVDPAAYDATFEALARIARQRGRILRLHVELFSPAPSLLVRLAAAARSAGMAPSPSPRRYQRTSLVDLTPEPPAIFAGFSSSARRNILAVAKHPVELRPIIEPALIPRMDDLLRDTMQRTGGRYHPGEWEGILRYSADHPERSRVIGLLRTDRSGPERLIAYAWGCMNGDHVQHTAAASARSADLRMPMSYCLAWDLMQWGRASGARYLDFGGITEGTEGGADPLGGISDFKRFFKGQLATVGDEWIAEPSRVAATLSRMLHRLGPAS